MTLITRIRVTDLETTGFSSPDHEVCEIGWQDVVLVHNGRWSLAGKGDARFVNPGRLIPPVTMAVHHIMDTGVARAPFWPEIAQPILQSEGGVLAPAAHRAAFEQRFCTPGLSSDTRWICT